MKETFQLAKVILIVAIPLSQKYIDIFAGTIGFWLFGYAISSNTDAGLLGEEQDYIFWFFRVSFLVYTNTLTHTHTHTHTRTHT